jgi:hypothetical protein
VRWVSKIQNPVNYSFKHFQIIKLEPTINHLKYVTFKPENNIPCQGASQFVQQTCHYPAVHNPTDQNQQQGAERMLIEHCQYVKRDVLRKFLVGLKRKSTLFCQRSEDILFKFHGYVSPLHYICTLGYKSVQTADYPKICQFVKEVLVLSGKIFEFGLIWGVKIV